MNALLRCLLLACVFAGATACATTAPVVNTAYDPAADFGAYRTFGFASPLGTDVAGYQSLVTQTLKSATRRELEARGYSYTEDSPDLLVNFGARLARQTDVAQVPAPPVYYGYRGGFYSGWGGYETRVDQYVEGTLNIDLVDARRKQLVWEGVAVGRVDEKPNPDRAAALASAVADIFAEYPYRAGN